MRAWTRSPLAALGLALAFGGCSKGSLEPPIFEARAKDEPSAAAGPPAAHKSAPEPNEADDLKPVDKPQPLQLADQAPEAPTPSPSSAAAYDAPKPAEVEIAAELGRIQGAGDFALREPGTRGFSGDGAGGAVPDPMGSAVGGRAEPMKEKPKVERPMGGEGVAEDPFGPASADAGKGEVLAGKLEQRNDDEEQAEDGKSDTTVRQRFANRDGDMRVGQGGLDPDRFAPPPTVLPRMFYFENTYLGGSAAYAERLRRLDAALSEGERHYQRVKAEAQPFDPPGNDGLGLTASVDATHIEGAQRVFLQVGIRGSDRYGWRRPPLDVVLVVDRDAFAQGGAVVTAFVVDLMRKLGSADRLGIVVADRQAQTFLELTRASGAQQHLARRIDALAPPSSPDDEALARAMRQAGAMLQAASDDEAVVPGSQTVLVLTSGDGAARVDAAAGAAHDLTIQGAVTSIFTLDQADSLWWQVANAGYGNFHRVTADTFDVALDEEMADLARVVARLLRVNVRLGKDVDAIRVLGTRVLDAREVEAVKAREVATDANLSKTMGITQDRGEDDDGIQTVIPYFYGDDSHVILIELWVKKPGLVADVTLRYKDMVNLDNATARTSVILGARPQAPTREQELIARNVRGFELGESLQHASIEVRHGNASAAIQVLDAARSMAAETNAADAAAVEGLRQQIEATPWQQDPVRKSALVESLLISGQRRVGDTAPAVKR